MTNEMKLLTALCDALGFEVEKTCVNQEALDRHTSQLERLLAMPLQEHAIYMPASVAPTYEYKLTKRDDAEHEDAELAAIVRARSGQPEVKISGPCPLAQFKAGHGLAQFKAGHDYSASLKVKD